MESNFAPEQALTLQPRNRSMRLAYDSRPHPTRFAGACALALTSVLALTLVPVQPATAATPFTVFDNTAYENVDIAGASEATFIPNYECQGMYAQGEENNETYYKNLVTTWITPTSELGVLDCEHLYLDSAGTAQYHYDEMLRLQGWAREVYPNMALGWYGLSSNTDPSLRGYYQDLLAADGNQAFLPSLYNKGESRATWAGNAQAALADANAIDASIPVYPYIWPQYHSIAPNPFDWVETGRWAYQMATLFDGGFDGTVVWGGLPQSGTCDSICQSEAATQEWIGKTEATIIVADKMLTDIALNKTATASSVNHDRLPEYAIDGSPYTRWNSEVDNPEWITVDLGATYSIDEGVRIVWTAGHSVDYTIEFSTDGSSWTQVYSCSCGFEGQRYHSTATGNARYVRITGTSRINPNWGNAMWSLNIYD